uniref:SYNPO2_0 protein n=2 Tax=Fopius arisanus TaxID=64838 RepID=A0A0C9RNN9_9HYME
MRRASFDKQLSTKRSNENSSYQYRVSDNLKNVEIKRLNYQNLDRISQLQRSTSADNVVIRTRGFKPSDRHDPSKRLFLEQLSTKILHFDMESGDKVPTPISLEKLLTPAMDCSEILQTKKKMYASSCFYAPTHPTVEDQVELARRISYSLSDAKNMKSKGQSMYVNRKKRSVKWIHDGNGAEADEEPQQPMHKDKVPLKCMMNPNGKVLDIHCIQALGEEPNIGTSPINADKLFDIVRDLNNQKGRGAEIFAKRRKRSEKWVVDKDQPSTPTQNYSKAPTYPSKVDYGANENSKFSNITPLSPNPPPQSDSKPFFNPFTMDLSLNNGTPPSATKMLESTYNGPKISSYQALTNYNTAPRGWDQSQAVYRPITFRKPQEPIAYSDF